MLILWLLFQSLEFILMLAMFAFIIAIFGYNWFELSWEMFTVYLDVIGFGMVSLLYSKIRDIRRVESTGFQNLDNNLSWTSDKWTMKLRRNLQFCDIFFCSDKITITLLNLASKTRSFFVELFSFFRASHSVLEFHQNGALVHYSARYASESHFHSNSCRHLWRLSHHLRAEAKIWSVLAVSIVWHRLLQERHRHPLPRPIRWHCCLHFGFYFHFIAHLRIN